jgi:hypothetical protein
MLLSAKGTVMTRVTIALHFVLLLTGPAYADQPARSG